LHKLNSEKKGVGQFSRKIRRDEHPQSWITRCQNQNLLATLLLQNGMGLASV